MAARRARAGSRAASAHGARRAFIGAGTLGWRRVSCSGWAGFSSPPTGSEPSRTGSEGSGQLGTWIRITPDNQVAALIPHCEMGQGALTGVAMLLAEELDADWSLVTIEQAPAEDMYANGYLARAVLDEFGYTVPRWLERSLDYASYKLADMVAIQTTGGSMSTRGTGQFGMRVAGAAARMMLLEAGSQELGVPVSELTTRDSRVMHGPSGRSMTYGELASIASTLEVPERPAAQEPRRVPPRGDVAEPSRHPRQGRG